MKIGIFGGSFNPPHKMHKKIGTKLIHQGILDKVIYAPTGNCYQKKDLIDAKYRYDMVKWMIEGNDRLEVSDYEIKNTLTYTYQTLNYFKSCYPNDEIYFICGMDNLSYFKTWKNYEYILDHFKIIVIKRNEDNLGELEKQICFKNIMISNIKEENISSTQIRKQIKDGMMNDSLDLRVKEYILKNKLYRK